MNNILLVFLEELSDIETFNNIIDDFNKEDYQIYLYDNLTKIDFKYNDLPKIIKHYKEVTVDCNKIVVLSNIRDLLFFWFRCYNQLVDDFIYLIDVNENNFFNVDDKFYSIYYNIFEFNGIETETINNCIYLTKKCNSILPLFYDAKYFQLYKFFDFNRKNYNVIKINKKYQNEEYEFFFQNFNTDNIESINLEKLGKRIVFFKGQSSYDVLRIATDYKIDFYKKLGYDVDLLDLLSADVSNIERCLKKNFEFAYSSNCIGIDLETSNGNNVFDFLDKPFIGALGDHPIHHYTRIIKSPKKTLFTCIDKENLIYFEKNFPDKKIITNYSNAYKSCNYKERKFCYRKIDILYVGTIIDPTEIKSKWNSYNPSVKKIIETISDKIIYNGKMLNIDQEVRLELLKENIRLNDANIMAIHNNIEEYVRFYKRFNLVKKLGESDLIVHCYGNRELYNKLNISGKLVIHDGIDYQELLDLFGDCKMVLNITGHLFNGVTERITSAMLNGAAVITERDNFTTTNFVNNKNIILYDFNNLDELINNLHSLLNDIPKLESIALEGCIEAKRYDFRNALIKFPRLVREFNKDFNKEITVTKTYLPNINKFNRYVNLIYESGQITNNGQLVRRLEKRLAEYLNVKNVVLVTNGTLALQIAFKALGLKGDVITTPFSFVATTSSLVWEGLNPVFVDIDKETLNIDVNKIEDKISDKTSAILPVHVYGNGCDVEKISEIASKYNLKVIYDAAHAFGVNFKDKNILQFGDISILSLHATKIFHSIEGGALIINDDELYEKVKRMINFGITGPESVLGLGINAKMNEFQAAMGLCVLDEIDVILAKRSFVHETYLKYLPSQLILPKHNQFCNYNYGYFPVIFQNENQLLDAKEKLEKNNILPRRYFYPSLDTLDYVSVDTMPIARDIACRILCLPMSADLSESDIIKIANLLQ